MNIVECWLNSSVIPPQKLRIIDIDSIDITRLLMIKLKFNSPLCSFQTIVEYSDRIPCKL